MRELIKPVIWFTILIVWAISMFIVSDRVNAWEKANNYPYGKLCDVYNNCSKK